MLFGIFLVWHCYHAGHKSFNFIQADRGSRFSPSRVLKHIKWPTRHGGSWDQNCTSQWWRSDDSCSPPYKGCDCSKGMPPSFNPSQWPTHSRSKELCHSVKDIPCGIPQWRVLIRWRLVIHGGIDGYSRLIVYLRCSANNRAQTVLSHFQKGVDTFGLPLRVCSDYGGENVDVWYYTYEQYQGNPSWVILGASTHNERIECPWWDVPVLSWSLLLIHSE